MTDSSGQHGFTARILSRYSVFQSTRPHGARPASSLPTPHGATSFNPRARTGRDLKVPAHRCADGLVSIHAPARRATSFRQGPGIEYAFQSTRPHGARRAYGGWVEPVLAPFQSTRPHGARLAIVQCERRTRSVSIHAPARGATLKLQPATKQRLVSIHAPARGATIARPWPRPAGGVSIHAPARGATWHPPPFPASQLVSIHAPARGATLMPC